MANPAAVKQYTRILSQWPKDLLRPDAPFARAIEHRAVPFGVAPVSDPEYRSKSAPKTTTKTASAQAESAQINALFSLLENRYANKYPITGDMLRPKSNPDHYDNLMAEIEEAPKKSWWQMKVDQFKSKIRFE